MTARTPFTLAVAAAGIALTAYTIPAMAEDASSVAGETASVAGAEPALEPAGVS